MVRDYEAFLRFLAERQRMPFAWGSAANDCVSFMVGAIIAQTGINPIPDLKWSTEAEADGVIESLGGLETAMSARLTPIAPAFAQRGDVAGVMSGNVLGVMIVEGANLVGPAVTGCRRRDRSDMILAWSAA